MNDLGEGVGVANEIDDSTPYRMENVRGEYGNSQDYKISKLKRDFGEKELMEH